MIKNRTAQEYRIKQFIELGRENSLNLDNTSLVNETQGVIIPIYNILRQKYRGIILENSVEVDFEPEVFELYKFKPKLLSLKLYGTTDLWHLILWLNDMVSVSEFTRKKVILFDPDAMQVLNRIVEKERKAILSNHENPEVVINEERVIRR
jgi:hypothetical protein